MARWTDLGDALARGGPSLRLSWSELDRIVGGLPPSATRHRAWWSGDRPHVRIWRAAGYTIAQLDLGEQVTFRRTIAGEAVPRMAPGETRTGQGSQAELVLIACARSKLDMPAPACQLYTSPLFRKGRAYAERQGVPSFILSAEHALVTPDQLLAPYERYLPNTSDSYRAAWGAWVVERLETLAGPLNGSIVEVHAGARYVDAIAPHVKAKGAVLRDPLAGCP